MQNCVQNCGHVTSRERGWSRFEVTNPEGLIHSYQHSDFVSCVKKRVKAR